MFVLLISEKGIQRLHSLNGLFKLLHVSSLNELSANGLYNLIIIGLYVLFINFHPHGVQVLHEFSATGLKRLSIKIRPCDVQESVDILLDSNIPGLNGLGMELYLNGLNGINCLGSELYQEQNSMNIQIPNITQSYMPVRPIYRGR